MSVDILPTTEQLYNNITFGKACNRWMSDWIMNDLDGHPRSSLLQDDLLKHKEIGLSSRHKCIKDATLAQVWHQSKYGVERITTFQNEAHQGIHLCLGVALRNIYNSAVINNVSINIRNKSSSAEISDRFELHWKCLFTPRWPVVTKGNSFWGHVAFYKTTSSCYSLSLHKTGN